MFLIAASWRADSRCSASVIARSSRSFRSIGRSKNRSASCISTIWGCKASFASRFGPAIVGLGLIHADSNSGNCSSTCSAMTVRRHDLHCISWKMRFAGTVCKKRIGWPQLGHAIKRSVSARSISVPSRPKHIKLILSDSLRRRIADAAIRRASFEELGLWLSPGSLLQPHSPAISLMGAGAMSNQGSATFGVTDRPACPNCGERPYLTRRSPHPDHDLRYELQIFTCSACDQTLERIVDANGNPPAELKCCIAPAAWRYSPQSAAPRPRRLMIGLTNSRRR
jgi:hypothetical protein